MGRVFGRLRGRLDALQSQAHGTMGDAKQALDLIEALLEDVQADGITITLENPSGESPLDFLLGKTKVCPVQIRIKP